MEIIIIILLILLNGLFSMSEMSLVSAKRFKLENIKKKGNKNAQIAIDLSENPNKFLSTVQIGITLIGILLGVYSGESFINILTEKLLKFNLDYTYAYNISLGIVVIGITFFSIVFGELLPKRIGMTFPEQIATFLARYMKILSVLVSPFVWLLGFANDILLTIIGIKDIETKVSEEDIKSMVKESAEDGEIRDIEHSIVERVFELGDRKVNTLFTHRSDISFLDLKDDWEKIKNKIHKNKHSAYPVCKNNSVDEVVGIVLLKDLFTPNTEKDFNIKNFMKKPLYINENTFGYKVLETFKKEKMHYGMVVDEYGTIIGMITMDDVLDALIGDMTEYNQDEYQIIEKNKNTWVVDGQYSTINFLKYFEIDLENIDTNQFSTVAGLVIHENATVPNIGEKINMGNYELQVLEKTSQRIDKIKITKKEKEENKE